VKPAISSAMNVSRPRECGQFSFAAVVREFPKRVLAVVALSDEPKLYPRRDSASAFFFEIVGRTSLMAATNGGR
jgi:hypothetical protein